MGAKAGSNRVKPSELKELMEEEYKPSVINFDNRTVKEPVEEDRIPIFQIDGKEYTIPRKPNMALGLRFTRDRTNQGADIALVNLLTAMIGEEGFEALVSHPDIEDSDMSTILEICSKAAMGKLEAQK